MNDLMVTCAGGWYKLSPFQAYSGIMGVTSDGVQLNATVPHQQAKQMDDDALAIINNTALIAPGEEGLRDIRVVEAVYRSVAQKAKVRIDQSKS
jgi:glucose-fructose oxidoreductase